MEHQSYFMGPYWWIKMHMQLSDSYKQMFSNYHAERNDKKELDADTSGCF